MEFNDIKIGNTNTFRKDFDERLKGKEIHYPPFYHEREGTVVWRWEEKDFVRAVFISPQKTEAEMIGLVVAAKDLLEQGGYKEKVYT
jgi:hypothetical protein